MTVMKKYLFIGLFLAIGFFFVGEANAQSISGSIEKGSVKKGTTASGYVVLNIPKGLHVNSYRPQSEYAIPTRLSVNGASNVNAFGVTYPAGKVRKFEFSDEPISVYEGRAILGFKVKVPSNYRGSTIRVKAIVRYQACTDEVCYAPKTKSIWITARVR
ncbi:MAG: protein-disulfide reductase DsbD domain-containing protein [Aridibacter sp.]